MKCLSAGLLVGLFLSSIGHANLCKQSLLQIEEGKLVSEHERVLRAYNGILKSLKISENFKDLVQAMHNYDLSADTSVNVYIELYSRGNMSETQRAISQNLRSRGFLLKNKKRGPNIPFFIVEVKKSQIKDLFEIAELRPVIKIETVSEVKLENDKVLTPTKLKAQNQIERSEKFKGIVKEELSRLASEKHDSPMSVDVILGFKGTTTLKSFFSELVALGISPDILSLSVIIQDKGLLILKAQINKSNLGHLLYISKTSEKLTYVNSVNIKRSPSQRTPYQQQQSNAGTPYVSTPQAQQPKPPILKSYVETVADQYFSTLEFTPEAKALFTDMLQYSGTEVAAAPIGLEVSKHINLNDAKLALEKVGITDIRVNSMKGRISAYVQKKDLIKLSGLVAKGYFSEVYSEFYHNDLGVVLVPHENRNKLFAEITSHEKISEDIKEDLTRVVDGLNSDKLVKIKLVRGLRLNDLLKETITYGQTLKFLNPLIAENSTYSSVLVLRITAENMWGFYWLLSHRSVESATEVDEDSLRKTGLQAQQ